MGFLGGLTGTAGGASGTGYGAPSGLGGDQRVIHEALSPVLNSMHGESAEAVYAQFRQQMALQQALQAQGGLQNQSQVYGQLQNMAQGIGPNPAQAQFQNNANQVAAQTAGLIGSQKGISPGLQARLIAQQGAGALQDVAGQAAVLQAQQQQAALEGAGNMANVMAGQQIGQTNALMGQRQNQQQMLLGALQGNIGQGIQMQGNVNNANAGLAGGVMGMQGQIIGGAMKGASGAATKGYNGGEVRQYSAGGPVSSFGRSLVGMATGGGVVPGQAKVPGDSPKNDTVPAVLSPGEIVIPRTIAQADNAPEMAARFVAAIRAKNGRGLG